MKHFAGAFFRSAFRATPFSNVPKYSSSYLQPSTHTPTMSSINWLNMQTLSMLTRCNVIPNGLNVMNMQNMTELIEKCKQETSLELDITKDAGLVSIMQRILSVARGLTCKHTRLTPVSSASVTIS